MISESDFYGNCGRLVVTANVELVDNHYRIWTLSNKTGSSKEVYLKDATTLFFPRLGLNKFLVNVDTDTIVIKEDSGGATMATLGHNQMCHAALGLDASGNHAWVVSPARTIGISGSPIVFTMTNFEFMDGTNADFMDGTNWDFMN